MKIFVFDTETTGFINKKETDLEKQPKVIQFAGILGTINSAGEFTEEKRIDILINPKMPIPFGSSEVHHIYDIDVKDAPYIEQVVSDIVGYINEPDAIIGHNIEYDEEMIKLELKRLGREFEYRPKQVICTMKSTVDFCAIQGNGERFKYPKLGELHKKLFDKYFIGAHDAMTDVEATLNCFIELVKKGIIVLEKKEDNLLSLF
ncbi:MAG: 3'-5' exonuclease [Candidatus Gracilibacteria bacterium]|nr:3'-5' exonuclease [Candidatus Gracilibacteria bacterium]